MQTLVAFPDLRRLVQPQDAVVHEDAGQFVADGAMQNQGGHGRVDAAAQRADDAAIADGGADLRRRLVDERRHRPVAGAAADPVREVAQDLEAALGVDNFRMKQNRVQRAARIRHRRDRRVGARRHHGKAVRRGGHEVAVACPHTNRRRHVDEERRRIRDRDRGVAELALRRRRHFPAERMRHQLHPVADAEHRLAEIEQRRVARRRAGVRDALGPARQDDARRVPCANRFRRRARRPDLRIHRQLAQAPGDELGVLRPEIEHDDGLVAH